MNTGKSDIEPYKSLQILDELSNNDSLTQRDLSDRLGMALGLVNSYIKNLAIKGFITVKSIPPKRYAYYLTPTGFAEKSRLAYSLLNDYTRVYREAKANLNNLFRELQAAGMKKMVFAGADEVAEIAAITLQETSLELVGVVDTHKAGEKLLGRIVRPVADIQQLTFDAVVVTSYVRRSEIHKELIESGIEPGSIKKIF